jgi:hypothetical protein
MSISIPALIDTQLGALQATLRPKQDGATNIASSPVPPYVLGNRAADIMQLLTDLVDAAGLTATGGTAASVQDTGAFTGVNALVGAKVTFVGNVTAALAGVETYVVSNTVNELFFAAGALPGTPAAGDTYSVEFTSVDADLAALANGKSLADSASNPYGPGPSFVNAVAKVMQAFGATMPYYMNTQDKITAIAEAFGIGSPHAGAGSQGHAGAALIADMLQQFRDAVAGYTAPA